MKLKPRTAMVVAGVPLKGGDVTSARPPATTGAHGAASLDVGENVAEQKSAEQQPRTPSGADALGAVPSRDVEVASG